MRENVCFVSKWRCTIVCVRKPTRIKENAKNMLVSWQRGSVKTLAAQQVHVSVGAQRQLGSH